MLLWIKRYHDAAACTILKRAGDPPDYVRPEDSRHRHYGNSKYRHDVVLAGRQNLARQFCHFFTLLCRAGSSLLIVGCRSLSWMGYGSVRPCRLPYRLPSPVYCAQQSQRQSFCLPSFFNEPLRVAFVGTQIARSRKRSVPALSPCSARPQMRTTRRCAEAV